MAVVQTLIGNIKGPAGATGPQGATGAAGAAATINVGTVSTTAYGNPAQVTNSGTESAAVFDFVIPQGQPGEEVTDMSGLVLGTMTTQTAEFPTPAVNDTGATLWGKVVKYFSDLRTLIGTKLNTSAVVNNLTTTEEGYALDARQANPNVSGTLAERVYALGNNTKIKSLAISANANTVFSVSNGTRAVLFCYNASASSRGEYIINANSSGTVSSTAVLAASALTITGSTTNTLTLANSGSAIAGYAIIFTGDITIPTT